MTITALVTSTLTSHEKKSARSAMEKETQTKAVYKLTNNLTCAKGINDIAEIAIKAISDCFACRAAMLCFDENGLPEHIYMHQLNSDKLQYRQIEDPTEYKQFIDNHRQDAISTQEFYDWPINGRDGVLGVIQIPKKDASLMNDTQTRLLRSLIESTALAMDRYRSAEQRIKLRDETVQERYRSNLLRAISHDLRTPLSGIMGTAEMLMDMTNPIDPRYPLAEGIYKDAD